MYFATECLPYRRLGAQRQELAIGAEEPARRVADAGRDGQCIEQRSNTQPGERWDGGSPGIEPVVSRR